MQLNLRFEADHVVGQHRDLRPEQLPIRLLRPRPFDGFLLASPAPSPDQQPGDAGASGEHHRKQPAAAAAIVVVGAGARAVGPGRRIRGVTNPLDEVVEHRGGVVAVGVERGHRQVGGLTRWQFAAPGPEAVPDEHTVGARAVNGVGHLAGHLGRVATGEIRRRRRQNDQVDRCVRAAYR